MTEPLAALRRRRLPLATLPTALEAAGRLPSGRRLLLKRDDLSGLGMGGNKARKLEMLCFDAVAHGADLLLTVGAAQSNHARVTAAAGARLGLETHLVLGGSAGAVEGNQLLSALSGAHLHYTGTDSWADLATTSHALEQQFREAGRTPYLMPIGGSTAVGASAFVLAWDELLAQITAGAHHVGAVVVSSSTGGTHAGLVAGAAVLGGPTIIAIDVAKESNDLAGDTLRLARETLHLVRGDRTLSATDVHVDDRFVGTAYAVPTPEADAAMLGLARSGGWVLDRVYTAKGFAGLLQLDREGALPAGDVVFWHTGGQPALFSAGGRPVLDDTARLLAPDLPSPHPAITNET